MSIGFKYNKTKKDDAVKVWDAKLKTWDYKIDGWEPKDYDLPTKDIISKESFKKWFNINDLQDVYDINKLMSFYKKEINDNKNNSLKSKLNLKKYTYYSALSIIFYNLELEFENKYIFYCTEKYENIYSEKPSLERLKTKKIIDIPPKIEELSGINFGIFNYWVFDDSIIFKN